MAREERSALGLARAVLGEQGQDDGHGHVFFASACPHCGFLGCGMVDTGRNVYTCETYQQDFSPRAFEAAFCGSGAGPALEGRQQERLAPRLPMWGAVSASEPPQRSPALIEGVLRRGHVALLSGKGKAGKSWSAIALSIAVATGKAWFGFEVERGTVLYIDPELDPRSLDNRFSSVAEAMGADKAAIDAHVSKWNLRGVPYATIGAVAGRLRDAGARFDLVVIDSCSYFVEGDENSSVDIRRFAAHVLQIAESTGAAVFLVHHMGKGNAGDRDVGERARGSSVWLDFPDAPLALTEIFPPSGEPTDYLQEGERAFVFEDAGLREFPSTAPKHLIFSHPAHRADKDGLTADWKPKSGQRSGGKSTGAANKARSADRAMQCELALMAELVAQGIGAEGMTASEAAEVCTEALGEQVNAQTLKAYIERSEVLDAKQTSPRRWKVEPRRAPPPRLL